VSVRRWELWSSEDEQVFFPEDNDQARRMAEEDGMTLEWEVTAKGWNAAAQAMYDYRGWGEYKPMLRSDGTPYPEDDDSPGH
jgi:hypothetical protein